MRFIHESHHFLLKIASFFQEATLKTKQPIRFQSLFKVTDQIAEKWKTKSIMWQILQLLLTVYQLLLFPPQKWMNLISDRLSTVSIKYLNWPSPVFGRFQNGCKKVLFEPRVVKFWSEIILVISNLTRTARSFDFEITRRISAQIALHSVQLPLLITWFKLNQFKSTRPTLNRCVLSQCVSPPGVCSNTYK